MNDAKARNLALAATVVTAFAALGAWLMPEGLASLLPTRAESLPQGARDSKGKIQREPKSLQNQPSEHIGRTDKIPQERLSHDSPQSSYPKETMHTWKAQSFEIADQEQRTLIPGCASLSVEFQEVDTVNFLTVRIAVDEDSTPYAVATAGERFRFSCSNNEYIASIIFIDHATRIVRVSLEKAAS